MEFALSVNRVTKSAVWFFGSMNVHCNTAPEPLDCLEPAQIQMNDGLTQLEDLYSKCEHRYRAWTNTVQAEPSSSEIEALLEEIRHRELLDLGIWNQISSTLTISTNDLPETARAAAFQDSVERLTAPDLACRNAREAFAIALAQDATACDAYMAWESQHQAEWEDYEAARSDYQRDCGPMCPGLFVSYGYQLVPRPEGKTNRASCET